MAGPFFHKKSLLPLGVAFLMGLSAVGLSGCGSGVPEAKPTVGRNPTVAETPTSDETVRGENEPAIVTLDLDHTLQEEKLSGGEELPHKIMIPTTNLNAVPITAALQAVLGGTDVSLSWNTGELGNRLVTVMNLSGPLPRVVERICSAAKVFCAYRHGSLELSEQETFIISLPPVPKGSGASATTNSMVDAISALSGGKAQIDEQGGNLIYTTDVVGQARVKQYLEQLRNGRPLVVLQLYIWEVTLDSQNGTGINWSQFKSGKISLGSNTGALSSTSNLTSLASTTGSIGIGAVSTGIFDTSLLFNFLSTQGRVQTVSNPQLTFVSGSNASLKVGGTQRYISQVGATTTASGTTSTSSTVTTDSIDTGLNIETNGSYQDGIIFANLKIGIKNIVALNATTTGSQTINLPETADESIETVIRVRPGDNLVMAGLVASNDTNDRQNLPLFGGFKLPSYSNDETRNRELVILVRPSVVLFSDKLAKAEKKQQEDAQAKEALIIDKDGAKTLTIPGAAPAQSPSPQSPSPAPETAPTPAPLPTAPSQNAAPYNPDITVDRRLMQRGFSHAYDELLQPSEGAKK